MISMKMDRNAITQYFEDYVRKYDFSDERIALKHKHSYKVAQICEEIAVNLGLNEYDVYVSWVIGMLHDIGRFEQLTNYDTYSDVNAVDHAKLGVSILREEDELRGMFSQEYYQYILSAIDSHNLYEIEEHKTGMELIFCQIIRDADKIDILRVMIDEDYPDTIDCTYDELIVSEVSQASIDELKNERVVSKVYRKTPADHIIGVISFFYGLYFDISREIMLRQGNIYTLMEIEYTNQSTRAVFEDIKHTFQNRK